MMKIIMCLIFSIGMSYFNMNFYLICFILSSYMLIKFNMLSNLWIEINSIYGMDYFSIYLVVLSLWVSGVVLLIKMNMQMQMMIFMLLLTLILSFGTFNFFMFYMMFEISLLPIFFLVYMSGYSFERFESMLYMFFFTMLSSIPFLVVFLSLFQENKTLIFMMLESFWVNMSFMMFLCLMIVFLVKMPMFFVHIWLPKAHVEAPVYGSMLLASVLLKLGSYGILRVSQIFFLSVIKYSSSLIMWSLIGGIFMSFVCMIQIDMKMLVAYSSVVHMSVLISSLLTLSDMGFIGSYMMMVGHGLCSSGLFFLVNLSYERTLSRLFYLNKGGILLNSSLSLWWFLLCSSNFSAPITLSLIGEVMILMSLFFWDFYLVWYLVILCLMGAVYSLFLFSYTQHGEMSIMIYFKKVNVKDFFILFLHWFPLNLITLNLSLFMI